MQRNVASVLVIGLGLGLAAGVGALFSACDNSPMSQAGSDMRETFDLRIGPGNLLVGALCDDVRTCGTDPKGSGPARCATVVDFDQVGTCAPGCDSDLDCDTIQPGLSICANMTMSKKECVIFCDKDKRVSGLECPAQWTCVASQGFRICRPPQTK